MNHSKRISKNLLARVSAVSPKLVLAIAGALIGAAAGQAVGPVLAGSVNGSVALAVEQAITVDTDYDIQDTGVSAGYTDFNDFLGLYNDEGTSFMVAIETWNGHIGEFSVPIVNYTEIPANAILRLSASPGIALELDSSVGVHEAQLGPGEWMLLVEPIDGDIFIAVHPQDDIQPGFYSITGPIVQIAG